MICFKYQIVNVNVKFLDFIFLDWLISFCIAFFLCLQYFSKVLYCRCRHQLYQQPNSTNGCRVRGLEYPNFLCRSTAFLNFFLFSSDHRKNFHEPINIFILLYSLFTQSSVIITFPTYKHVSICSQTPAWSRPSKRFYWKFVGDTQWYKKTAFYQFLLKNWVWH